MHPKLMYCTITGAADDVDLKKMEELSKRYTFLEWGFLISSDRAGTGRYPSRKWLMETRNYKLPKVSFHICGEVMRKYVQAPERIKLPTPNFESPRYQFNFNNNAEEFTINQLSKLNKVQDIKNIIFQWNKSNEEVLCGLIHKFPRMNFSVLYDGSGGHGRSPTEWKRPISGYVTGYAGGLGPDNIVSQIKKIEEQVGPYGRYWIDMESKVRTTDDRLDLEKVESVLQQVFAFKHFQQK